MKKILKNKAFLVVLLIILVVGYGYFLVLKEDRARNLAKLEAKKFDNIEQEIFDLGKDVRMDEPGQNASSELVKRFGDLTIEDLKNDDDFLYQVLIQNQLDLRRLSSQMKILEIELAKFKSQAKLQKMIMTYVNLRELIFAGKPHKDKMQSFRLLAVGNKPLMDEVRELEDLAKDFKSFEELEKELAKSSRTLIALKKHDPNAGFFEKIRFNIAKIITVRKLDEKSQDVDGVIYRLQNALKEKDCDLALEEVEAMDEKYQEEIIVFKGDLQNSCKLRKIDDEIMLYLENLSLVN